MSYWAEQNNNSVASRLREGFLPLSGTLEAAAGALYPVLASPLPERH